jgi:hypothetical protein
MKEKSLFRLNINNIVSYLSMFLKIKNIIEEKNVA